MKKNPLLIVLGLSAGFFVVFLIVTMVAVSTFSRGSGSRKKLFTNGRSIGVVEVNGAILDSKGVLDQIENASEDTSIKGVIVRINSPGGAVAPSQEIYESLRKLGKKMPVYVSMGSVAASGGYYIACGAKKIFASPGTLTGSIGVIMHFADLSKLFQFAKVSPYTIKTGRYKDIGSPHREMSVEEKALLQGMVDNVLGQFRRAISAGRNLPMEKIIPLSDGRIFSGEQAKEHHLVDELGGLDDTVDAIAKELGMKEKPHLVYLTHKRAWIEKVFGDEDSESDSSSIVPALQGLGHLLRLLAKEGASTSSSFANGPLFLAPLLSE